MFSQQENTNYLYVESSAGQSENSDDKPILEKLIDLIHLKFGMRIIIRHADVPEPKNVELIFPDVDIEIEAEAGRRGRMVPEWKKAVAYLSSFTDCQVKTGFSWDKFGNRLEIHYSASLTIGMEKMDAVREGLLLLPTLSGKQAQDQHNARRYAAC